MFTIIRRWSWALALACFVVPAHAQVVATPDPVGDALRILLPLGAAGMTLYHQDLQGLKEFGITLAVSQGTSEIVKHTVHSPRPDGTGYGAVSGHTSAAFAAAGFVHRRYGAWEAAPFYALATVTGWERVHHDHHYTSQVVGGAVIGFASAFLFTEPLPDGGRLSLQMRGGGPWLAYARAW